MTVSVPIQVWRVLAKLRPMFDKRFGQVTAGNSSQITDGAAFLLLANQAQIDRYQLPVLAKICGCAVVGAFTCYHGIRAGSCCHSVIKTSTITFIRYVIIGKLMRRLQDKS